MVPFVGKMVLYRTGGSNSAPKLRPAVIWEINSDGTVELQVFTHAGVELEENVAFGDAMHQWRPIEESLVMVEA
jgi:hypothetical protein